jgi:hypothetical protein
MVRYLLLLMMVIAAGCASQEQAVRKNTAQAAVTFSGGNGESGDSAIVIHGIEKPSEGVEAEYRYLSQLHGIKDKSWRVESQVITREEKNVYDVIEIMLVPSSQKRIYYFEVIRFSGKRKPAE